MPEFRLGSTPDMEDVRLGATQIEAVYLGSDLIWRNNEPPQFNTFSVNGNSVSEGSTISIPRNSTSTINFTLGELEGDTPYDVRYVFNGVHISNTTVSSNGGSGSFTITPSMIGGSSGPAGVLDDVHEVSILAADVAGGQEEFSFNIGTLTVSAPSVTTSPSGNVTLATVGPDMSQTWSYSYNLPTSGAGLTLSAPGPDITATASCGGTDSVSTQVPVITSTIPGGTLSPVSGTAATRTLTLNGVGTATATANVVAGAGEQFTVSPGTVSDTYTGLCGSLPSSATAAGTVTLTALSGFSFSGANTFSYSVPATPNGGTHTITTALINSQGGGFGADVTSTVTYTGGTTPFAITSPTGTTMHTGPSVATFSVTVTVELVEVGVFVESLPSVNGVSVPFTIGDPTGTEVDVTISGLSYGSNHTIALSAAGSAGSVSSVVLFTGSGASGALSWGNSLITLNGASGATADVTNTIEYSAPGQFITSVPTINMGTHDDITVGDSSPQTYNWSLDDVVIGTDVIVNMTGGTSGAGTTMITFTDASPDYGYSSIPSQTVLTGFPGGTIPPIGGNVDITTANSGFGMNDDTPIITTSTGTVNFDGYTTAGTTSVPFTVEGVTYGENVTIILAGGSVSGFVGVMSGTDTLSTTWGVDTTNDSFLADWDEVPGGGVFDDNFGVLGAVASRAPTIGNTFAVPSNCDRITPSSISYTLTDVSGNGFPTLTGTFGTNAGVNYLNHTATTPVSGTRYGGRYNLVLSGGTAELRHPSIGFDRFATYAVGSSGTSFSATVATHGYALGESPTSNDLTGGSLDCPFTWSWSSTGQVSISGSQTGKSVTLTWPNTLPAGTIGSVTWGQTNVTGSSSATWDIILQ